MIYACTFSVLQFPELSVLGEQIQGSLAIGSGQCAQLMTI
jgi:hypothetical protein